MANHLAHALEQPLVDLPVDRDLSRDAAHAVSI